MSGGSTMLKHTSEPWHIDREWKYGIASQTRPVWFGDVLGDHRAVHNPKIEDMERIVLCVNACKGISEDVLLQRASETPGKDEGEHGQGNNDQPNNEFTRCPRAGEDTTPMTDVDLTIARNWVRKVMNDDPIDLGKVQTLVEKLQARFKMTRVEILRCLYVCGLRDGVERMRQETAWP